jgi:hypothetical protein
MLVAVGLASAIVATGDEPRFRSTEISPAGVCMRLTLYLRQEAVP